MACIIPLAAETAGVRKKRTTAMLDRVSLPPVCFACGQRRCRTIGACYTTHERGTDPGVKLSVTTSALFESRKELMGLN